MKIINSYQHADAQLKSDIDILAKLAIHNHKPVHSDVLNYVKTLATGSTMVVHSGSWNYDIDAVYLESKNFQPLSLNFHPCTKFIDYPFNSMVEKLLFQNPVDCLLFLHSPLTKYRTIQQLDEFLKSFRNLVRPQGSIIAVIDLLFLNFNRLTTGYQDVIQQLDAVRIHNDLVVCR